VHAGALTVGLPYLSLEQFATQQLQYCHGRPATVSDGGVGRVPVVGGVAGVLVPARPQDGALSPDPPMIWVG
jgi:hypothetical protein